jgi:hypothetical protein
MAGENWLFGHRANCRLTVTFLLREALNFGAWPFRTDVSGGRMPTKTKPKISEKPERVMVAETFKVRGSVDKVDAGRTVNVKVDDKFDFTVGKVEADGKFEFEFRFQNAGHRSFLVDIGGDLGQSVAFFIDVSSGQPVSDAEHGPGRPLPLSGSVGRIGANKPEDVARVRARLADLGFPCARTGGVDQSLILAIRLFQSAVLGTFDLQGDGRIDVNQGTHKFLQANNAPRWQSMPINAKGFRNFDRGDQDGGHDFGTSWLSETVLAAAADYEATHRKGKASIALLVINDLSLPEGGDTPAHAGHETGLEADILLPRKDGDFGAIRFFDPLYDRTAARAIIKSFQRQPLFLEAFFNDDTLIAERLCFPSAGHDNHIHIRIRPPQPN